MRPYKLGDVDPFRLDMKEMQEEDIIECLLIALWNDLGREFFVRDLEEFGRLIHGVAFPYL